MKRFLLIMLACLSLPAQTFGPVGAPVFRAFDANGIPLVGGLLWSYAAGTTTPKNTFTDASGGTPNTNPAVLDATGQAKIFLGSGGYKFILEAAPAVPGNHGIQQWTIDNIQGPLAPGVNTFAGRAGTVVPATGDYNCSMITNASCLPLATVFYQTVKVGGTAQTQEPALNLIAGTGMGVACTDTATVSTNCTLTPTPPVAITQTDVTGSRTFATNFVAGTKALTVSVVGLHTAGSGDSKITASVGATSGTQIVVASNTSTSTVVNSTVGVTFVVPAGYTYSVTYVGISGTPTLALSNWLEWALY